MRESKDFCLYVVAIMVAIAMLMNACTEYRIDIFSLKAG